MRVKMMLRNMVANCFFFGGILGGTALILICYIMYRPEGKTLSAFMAGAIWATLFGMVCMVKLDDIPEQEESLLSCISRGWKVGCGIYVPHFLFGLYEFFLIRGA